MREVLFRGRSVDTDEWIQGDLSLGTNEWVQGDLSFDRDGNPYIRYWKLCGGEPTYTVVKVEPDTVGQYTGMKDKNGTRIFEGDLLKYDQISPVRGRVAYVAPVVFSRCEWKVRGWSLHSFFTENNRMFIGVEVVGNIHDSPELLEVQK